MDKAFEASRVEGKWYSKWKEGMAFAGKRDTTREPFTIMIPPPNVTGMLHMGHILNNTLQDIFIRRARLEGKAALWYPGTDHAGIATQTRVEKKLRAEGKHRRDLGREAFLEQVWQWREEHGGIILNQLQKLGASCDWDRTSFTLDEPYSKAVLTAFVELYKRGYLYRGQRMSNWCPVSQTALSNEEVIMKPQKGLLYKMRYELVDQPGSFLEISTTRPETIMGDVAVAVHPDDPRYRHLIGQFVWRPFPRKAIPIIADSAVEIEFGTGCLKVTPAHDPVDFEIGKRHDLPILDVFNPDGTLNELAGPDFEGMDRFAARKKAAALLEELGNLVETESYENSVGFSERADVPVEPRLTEQWWLRYPKVDEARKAVTGGHLRFHPKRWEKTYLHWLETMERDSIDWCVSRQLWWGHRIPVWYRKGIDRSDLDFSNPDHVHVSVEGPEDPGNWEQEEDVLDTWASSWLWPFANFGWPEREGEKGAELDYFYPTSTLVTGFDIIFLWVARMVMAGLEFMGPAKKKLEEAEIDQRIPFKDVFITGLIRDSMGRKMSKSLGNSPDPLDLIAKFGADGLRFGIVNIAPSGQDILFSEDRIEIGRNFCTKLWNACRFREMSGPLLDNRDRAVILSRMDPDSLDIYDRWILARLVETTSQIESAFARYEMHGYPHALYEFFWSEYCDWYVEIAKPRLREDAQKNIVLAVQDFVVRHLLQLLQPLAPFITEELWEIFGFGENGSFLQDSPIARSEDLIKDLGAAGIQLSSLAVEEVSQIQETITGIRSLKSTYNVNSRKDLAVSLLTDSSGKALLERHQQTLLAMAQIREVFFVDAQPEGMPAQVVGIGTCFLDLSGAIDVDAEKDRLSKELAKLEKGLKAGEAKLTNQRFLQNAPPEVVAGAQKQLEDTRQRYQSVKAGLSALGT